MSAQQTTRSIIELHWLYGNTRQWDRFSSLLHPDMVYEVPQTRERLRGSAAYTAMFRDWPGDWRGEIKRIVAEPVQAVSVIDFIVGAEHMTGITFFDLHEGLITHVTDVWPSDYEPPERVTPMERY